MLDDRVLLLKSDGNYHKDIAFLLDMLNIEERIAGKRNVVIKPNLFCAEPSKSGATIDLDLLSVVIEYFIERKMDVSIVEAAAHQYEFTDLFSRLGIAEFCVDRGAKFINLNNAEVSIHRVTIGKCKVDLRVPKVVTDADFFVNIPKLKTHAATGVTLAMKNLYGLLPGNMKWKGHACSLNETIICINNLRKSDLVIMDAIIAMEGFGPTMGIAKRKNILVAACDAVIHDTAICRIAEFQGIKHIEKAVLPAQPQINYYIARGQEGYSNLAFDLSLAHFPRWFNRLWYYGHQVFYKLAPKLTHIGITPRHILNAIVTDRTIKLARWIQRW